MDDESGDDDRDGLTSEWGGESRHDRRGWRKEYKYKNTNKIYIAPGILKRIGAQNQGVDSRDGVMHIWMSDLWFSVRWLVGEKGWQPMRSGYCEEVCHEGSPVGKRSVRWEGFVEKVGFEPGVKEWRSDGWWEWWWWQRWADKWMRRWVKTWLHDGEADGMNQGVDSRDGVMHIWIGGRERVTTDAERVLWRSWTEIRLLVARTL